MAPRDPTPEHVPTRRELTHHRRARRRRRLLTATGVAALAVAVGLVVSDTVRLPSGDAPHLGAEPARSTARAVAPSADRPGETPPRPLSATQPLRLWIGGDSLAGSLGVSLGEMTAATEVVQPQYLARVSTGLASPDFFDWPAHATLDLAQFDPEVVVFIIGANDASTYDARTQHDQYAQLVDTMMRVLVGQGREVYWVGAPIMRDHRYAEQVRAIDTIQQEVAQRHPEVTYVDAYNLFSDANGQYTSTLPDATGKRVVVRAGDGVHLTPEGGDLLAARIFTLLDARWHLRAQAVPGAPRTVIQSKDSTLYPGTYRSQPGPSSVPPRTSGSTRRSTSSTRSSTSSTRSPAAATSTPPASTGSPTSAGPRTSTGTSTSAP